MIKVSHEFPFYLLEKSLKYNDYQYCLPHLLDKEPEYAKFFKKYKANGGYIIMDNSLHELGEAYDGDSLIHWVNELEPDEFIVPDVWENSKHSIMNAIVWSSLRENKNIPKSVKRVAVVQAKNINQAAQCYQNYKNYGYDKIAFSYGASYYNNISKHPNRDLGRALGRIQVIFELLNKNVISPKDKIHLLGCSVPQEFGWYNNLKIIDSIDTSNPIMATIEGTRYRDSGLQTKPKANIQDNFYEFDIDPILLDYNLKKFRKINDL